MDYQWKKIQFTKEIDKVPSNLTSCRHAAHALLFCASENLNLFEHYPMRYAVMMQLRHDGMLGFPGGYIDKEESVAIGLNRELLEEINLDKKHFFNNDDYFGSWIHNLGSSTLVDHFFVKQFSQKDFLKIEKATLESQDWGKETLGILRVPVYDLEPLGRFFGQNFVGNARDQLVKVLIERDIYSINAINIAWKLHLEKR